MIDSIAIKGYKSFKDIKVDLQPINILIGGNGSGKSNFLSVLDFLGDAYDGLFQTTIARVGGVESIVHHGLDVTQRMSIKLREGKIAYALDLVPSELVMEIESEKLGYFTNANKWVYTPITHCKNELELKWYCGDIPCDSLKKSLSQLKRFHFHDTGLTSPLSRVSNIENDIFYLYKKGENIAAFLYKIKNKDPKAYKHIMSPM